MKKYQVIEKLNQAWHAFCGSFAGLSDEQMLIPGVTGEWSVKHLIAHVTWWEQEALKHLPHILQGLRPPRYSVLYGGIDAFNTLMARQTDALSLEEVRAHLESTHQALLDYLQSVPEEHFTGESRFRRRLKLDTYGHYPIHTRAILEWRQNLP